MYAGTGPEWRPEKAIRCPILILLRKDLSLALKLSLHPGNLPVSVLLKFQAHECPCLDFYEH